MFFLVACGSFAVIALEKQRHHGITLITWDTSSLIWALLFQGIFIGYAAHLWKSFVHITTKFTITHSESFNHLVAITMGKYLPGKLWGLVARGVHFRRHGMNTADYAQMSFLEQYLLLLACAILALLSAPLFLSSPLSICGELLVVPTLVAGYYFQDIAYSTYRTKFPGKLLPEGENHAVFQKLSPTVYLLLTFGYSLLWILNGTVLVALFGMTKSVPLDALLATKIIACNAIAVSIGFLALFSPGGIGVREASIAAILGPSIGTATAVNFAIIYRIFTIASELACGAIVAATSWKKES